MINTPLIELFPDGAMSVPPFVNPVFTVLVTSVSTPPAPFVQIRPGPFTVELVSVTATASEKSAPRVTVTLYSATDPAPFHAPPRNA